AYACPPREPYGPLSIPTLCSRSVWRARQPATWLRHRSVRYAVHASPVQALPGSGAEPQKPVSWYCRRAGSRRSQNTARASLPEPGQRACAAEEINAGTAQTEFAHSHRYRAEIPMLWAEIPVLWVAAVTPDATTASPERTRHVRP